MMEGFGAFLRGKREEVGLSLSDISEKTRISLRHLQAMESGAFHALPGPVYAQSFIRHYARAVGIDPEMAIAEFRRLSPPPEQTPVTLSTQLGQRARLDRRVGLWQWAGALALLAVLGGLVAWAMNGLGNPPIEDHVAREEPSELVAELDGAAGFVDALDSAPTIDPPSEPSDELQPIVWEPEEQAGRDAPADLDPGLPDDNAAVLDEAEVEPEATEATEPTEPDDEELALFGVVLQVDVLRDCWFEVIADGVRIFTGVIEGGEGITWTAEERLEVRYGAPEGVRITLNGRYLGAAGSGVITRVYTPDGVEEPVVELPAVEIVESVVVQQIV